MLSLINSSIFFKLVFSRANIRNLLFLTSLGSINLCNCKLKSSFEISNQQNLYTISVGFGAPPTYHDLGISTGSANTFGGNVKHYQATNSSVDLKKNFFTPYGFGNVSGTLVKDLLTFGSDNEVRIHEAVIGNTSRAAGFESFDGLLGLGLSAQSYPRNKENIGELMTPFGLMYSRDMLEKATFGLSFMPSTSKVERNGLITFGGVEQSRFVGEIQWYSCSSYHTWDWTATISYGDQNLSGKSIMGGFDSAYTNTPALPKDIFDKYVLSIPGALWDDSWLDQNNAGVVGKHMLRIPKSSVAQMEDLCFTSGGTSWCLVPEAQLVPDGVITDGEPGYRYGYVTPIRKQFDQGISFIFGMKAMERFYVAFDLANYRIGLAQTSWTNSTF
ncbi:aspartic peptidase domain-containing protein [Phakopsora pachyrhizi]|uniref:Aspartic peptidase domain-containing protein n=2 Tax=Phakopsora pachyrhizi TaxID=170000 RepID=A0AAV0B1H0_PHAPC|nr:aspartic peptidase domain-containing protein [Phakopsora pachyrhizi]CAH7676851.1 aspartic peptidase domain-containing protein [Phakopsora pachyrhizi]